MKKKKPLKKPATQKVTLAEQRYRLSPVVLRLTEGADGIHVPTKIQLFRTGTFKKQMENGKTLTIPITRETLSEMVENWKNKVRGQDIAVDFAHKSDEEAAAWFTNVYLEETPTECQLWAEVEWTPDGYAAVGGKKFRYLSPDFAFAWTDNETGKKYGATLFGAGLTNRPVIKNMAPTVELTEVHEMAKKTAKKISEMTMEELTVKLAEETDEEKKELIQLRLDEMAEDDEADDGEADGDDDGDEKEEAAAASDKKKKAKAGTDMNFEELKAAYQKQCDEMAEMRKSMAKSLAEQQKREKETQFTMLLAEGKVVPAQKEAFLANDMIEFTKLAQSVKFDTTGAHGAPVAKTKTDAQDEVLKLAEEAVKAGKTTHSEKISYVLSENPKLHARYIAEMEGEPTEVA